MGTLAALGTILLRLFPSSCRQFVEKKIREEDMVLDTQVGNGIENNLNVIESIILAVA